MSTFKVAFCIRDQEYAGIIENYLKSLNKNNLEIYFISENKVLSKYKNIVIKEYFQDGNLSEEIKLDDIIWKNSQIYKADPRYINKKNNFDLQFQNKYIDACRNIFSDYSFDLVFSGSAGRLIWTIPHLVAIEQKTIAYKLVPADYLNPYFKGFRLWFCTDIFWDIDLNSSYDFNWSKSKIDEQISLLQNSMLKDDFNLASRAIKSRESYTPSKFNNIVRNLLKVIFQNDFLSKQRLLSFYNSKQNLRHYSEFTSLKNKYFIYPLNQPFDEQLLVRAPNYINTVDNIKMIANCLPKNIDLIIKEHPVNPGMLSHSSIKKLKKKYSNIKFVNPRLPIRPLIQNSEGLITINSTAGIEALICNKNIIVLGQSYYKYNSMVYKPKNEEELKDSIYQILNLKNFDFTPTKQMLKKLLCQTYPEPSSYPDKSGDGNAFIQEAVLYKINQLYEEFICNKK